MTVPSRPALSITTPAGARVRVELGRALTTIGSATGADVRIAGVPAQWLVCRRLGERLELAVIATGQRFVLGDAPLVIEGATIARADAEPDAPLAVGPLALALSQAGDPNAALGALLEHVLVASGADVGAIVLRQDGGHAIAVARDASGVAIRDGAAILSDTVLHEVLAGGHAIAVDDTAADPRLAHVPSVINLALRSVIAIPMVLGDEIVGALYLGARSIARRVGPRLAADLAVAASLAMPLVAQLRRAVAMGDLGGASPAIVALRGLIARVAPTDLAVLVTGETGTGKELVARALHAQSPRRERPMIAVNCAAIPANLFEAELFGHKKGAFTGATADRAGRLEAADGSTLFLDEIGELPPAMQAALLRALQEREVIRVGENEPRRIDFRLVCATNRELDAEVAAGRFRADLLFRLREITIELPPLRARGGDVLQLAERLLADAEAELGTLRHRLGEDARAALLAHDWPGNVRELRAVMRRAAVLADGSVIAARDLGLPAPRHRPSPAAAPAIAIAPAQSPPPSADDLERPLALARDQFVAGYCAAVLARHGGNREAAAAALGISTRSLYRYLNGDRD
jgi:transcriptional regulator with GAF, ATPase, and Fis domain